MSEPAQPACHPRRALVIGVNGAAHGASIAPLLGAERDARTIAAALETPQCAFAVELYTGEQCTAAELRQKLEDLLYEATTESDLLVYFSGHAVPVALASRHNETFLVTSDFDATRAARQPGRYLSLRWLYENLYRNDTARTITVLLDCCFAGNILGLGDDRLTVDFRAVIEQFRTGLDEQTSARFRNRLRVIIPAAGPGQTAREQDGAGVATRLVHALLSGAVPIERLDDGRVTVDLVIDRLRKELPDLAPMTVGQGVCVLADYRAEVAAARAASSVDQGELREQRLLALCHDHSGFIASRLEAFVGRERELADIRERIAAVQASGGYVTVTGHAGQGKSSIIARLLQEFGAETTAHHFIPLKPGPDHQVGLLRNLLARLIRKHNLAEIYVASDSRPALRDYFAQALREIAAAGKQEIIIIDGLDQIEEDVSGERDLSFLPLEPPPGIVFLLGTRPNDTLKPLELRKPHREYWLPNLGRADFALILQHRGVALEAVLADRFYAAMQENALYLDLVARELARPGAPDPEVLIARLADNPDNLFSLGIERLRRDHRRWRTVLKPILGLLLAVRDPLSLRAIRTLLGVDDDACRDGLRRLGGLLARDGEGRYYLYHLKLTDFLRQDLALPSKEYVFASDEEESYHQRLADWSAGGRGGLTTIWQDVSSDALERERRAYARQHYIPHLATARSYDQLWGVVDTGDYGRAKLRHDPSGRSYVLDLDVARDAVIASAYGDLAAEVAILPRLWRYSLLRCSISSRADKLPDQFFELMAQLGQEQEAINLAELLTDPQRKAEVLGAIAMSLDRAGENTEAMQVLARAQQVARDIGQPERRAKALVAVSRAAIKLTQLDQAAILCTEATNAANATPYTALKVELLCAIATAQKEIALETAHAILDEARQLAARSTDAKHHARNLRVVAEALAQAAAFVESRAVADAIEDPALRANALRAIARALAQTDAHTETLAALMAARTASDAIADVVRRVFALIGVASIFVSIKAYPEALATLADARREANEISLAYSRAHAFSDLASTLARSGAFTEARTTADVIEDALIRAEALSKIAAALAKADAREEALQTLAVARSAADAVEGVALRSFALSATTAALARIGAFTEAHATADAIEDASIHAEALSNIAAALAKAGMRSEARGTLTAAYKAANAIEDADLRFSAFCDMAAVLARTGAFTEARTIAEAIKDAAIRTEALNNVATALVNVGARSEARGILATAHNAANAIEHFVSRSQALSAMSEVLARMDARSEALGILSEARIVADRIEDPHDRARALSVVAKVLASIDALPDALATLRVARTVVNAIESPYFQAEALSALTPALAQAGAYEDAHALANSIEYSRQRVEALGAVAIELAKTGAHEKAINTLAAARAVAESVEVSYFRAEALSALITTLAQIGAYEDALTLASCIEEVKSRSRALNAIATALVDADARSEALTVLETALIAANAIDNVSSRSHALGGAAELFARAGMFDAACTLAGDVEDTRSRASALCAVAELLVREGRKDNLCALVLREWRFATTLDYLWRITPLLQGQLIVESQLTPHLLDGPVWVQQVLSGREPPAPST